MTEVTCDKCGYSWSYSGDSSQATCPNCYSKTSVRADQAGVSMEWVTGVDEVTVWLWPETPDPVTVRFSLREWAKIERKARDEYAGDVEAFVTRVVTADLEDHKAVLSD